LYQRPLVAASGKQRQIPLDLDIGVFFRKLEMILIFTYSPNGHFKAIILEIQPPKCYPKQAIKNVPQGNKNL